MTTARTTPRPRAKRAPKTTLTALADKAYDAMHNPLEANRIESMTELLAGLGINGRRVASHLGLAAPAPKPNANDRPLPFRKRRTRKVVAS